LAGPNHFTFAKPCWRLLIETAKDRKCWNSETLIESTELRQTREDMRFSPSVMLHQELHAVCRSVWSVACF